MLKVDEIKRSPNLYEEVINGNILLYSSNYESNASALCGGYLNNNINTQTKLWMQYLEPVPTTSFDYDVRCWCKLCGKYHELHTSDWVDVDKIKQMSWDDI